jgi:hypothetical protein
VSKETYYRGKRDLLCADFWETAYQPPLYAVDQTPRRCHQNLCVCVCVCVCVSKCVCIVNIYIYKMARGPRVSIDILRLHTHTHTIAQLHTIIDTIETIAQLHTILSDCIYCIYCIVWSWAIVQWSRYYNWAMTMWHYVWWSDTMYDDVTLCNAEAEAEMLKQEEGCDTMYDDVTLCMMMWHYITQILQLSNDAYTGRPRRPAAQCC